MRKVDPTWLLQMHTLLCCKPHLLPPTLPQSSVQMASYSNSKPCAENLCDEPPSTFPGSSLAVPDPELPQQEYDFVEELPPEYFCLITFELLRDPKQTECCGHHLSGNVVARLKRESKPCPLCNDPDFMVISDKYFRRKVEELKVRCPNKRDGCEWEGDLGNLDHHSKSCPKRPWQCPHCHFRATYDIGTTDHLPNCTKYPEPCPNQCDIGTVPHCEMEKHLTECPLQLVGCEFAQYGCQKRIPRQDLSWHMEEGTQHHLLSISLLNLSLTRELHQKMDEKDQQIAELQKQLQEHDKKLEEQFQEIESLRGQGKQTETQLQKQLETGFTRLQGQIDEKVTDLQQVIQQQGTRMQKKLAEQQQKTKKQISEMQTQLQDEKKMLQTASKMQDDLLRQGKEIQSSLYTVSGFRPPFKFTLTKFSKHMAQSDEWYSDSIYYPEGNKFKLNILANGCGEAKDTHISAYLFRQVEDDEVEMEDDENEDDENEDDDDLEDSHEEDDNEDEDDAITVTAILLLLNQRGDHSHVVASVDAEIDEDDAYIEIALKFIAHSKLEYNAAKDTQYLKNDCLSFRLYLKGPPQTKNLSVASD